MNRRGVGASRRQPVPRVAFGTTNPQYAEQNKAQPSGAPRAGRGGRGRAPAAATRSATSVAVATSAAPSRSNERRSVTVTSIANTGSVNISIDMSLSGVPIVRSTATRRHTLFESPHSVRARPSVGGGSFPTPGAVMTVTRPSNDFTALLRPPGRRRVASHDDIPSTVTSSNAAEAPNGVAATRGRGKAVKRRSVSTAPKPTVAENQKQSEIIECPLCFDTLREIVAAGKTIVATHCGHLMCNECFKQMSLDRQRFDCPICRKSLKKSDVTSIFLGT